MEDFILVIIFLVISLISYINKLRESKRGRTFEPLEEDADEREWAETLFGPETKPAKEETVYPDAIPQAPTRRNGPAEVERAYEPPVKAPSSSESTTVYPSHLVEAKEILPSSSTTISAFDNLKSFSNQHDSLVRAKQPKKNSNTAIDFRSKISLRKAILVREILDRPRAYDI